MLAERRDSFVTIQYLAVAGNCLRLHLRGGSKRCGQISNSDVSDSGQVTLSLRGEMEPFVFNLQDCFLETDGSIQPKVGKTFNHCGLEVCRFQLVPPSND